jgi:hypothetical protein
MEKRDKGDGDEVFTVLYYSICAAIARSEVAEATEKRGKGDGDEVFPLLYCNLFYHTCCSIEERV